MICSHFPSVPLREKETAKTVGNHPVDISPIGATDTRAVENIACHVLVTKTDDRELEKYWLEVLNINEET